MPLPRLNFNPLPWLTLPLIVLNGWCFLLLLDYFHTPLTILTLGTLLAFLLEHPVQWLVYRKVKRRMAISLVLGISLIGLGILGATLFPLLTQQANQLAGSLSDWAKSAEIQVRIIHNWATRWGIPIDLSGLAQGLTNQISTELQVIASQFPRFVVGALGSVFQFLLTLIVTIYLLFKGKRLWDGVFSWFPPEFGDRIRTSLPRVFRNYFMGQGTVGLLLGTLMATLFTLFRIPFSLLFGAFIGFMGLFPFGASLGIAIVTVLVSLKSIGLGITVLAIAILTQQIVENGIAPRLLGRLTGIHPIWVILALLIGDKIAGILGIVLAVPLASFIKEILEAYKPRFQSSASGNNKAS